MAQEPVVGLVFFPAFDWAISPDHPERQERLLYTRDQIQEEGLFDHPRIREFRPRLAEDREILRTHVVLPSLERNITESHRIAAGGTIVAADLVVDGTVDRAFALLRPPGHHANRFVHGARGFCVLNNEAIMVDHLRHRLGQISGWPLWIQMLTMPTAPKTFSITTLGYSTFPSTKMGALSILEPASLSSGAAQGPSDRR